MTYALISPSIQIPESSVPTNEALVVTEKKNTVKNLTQLSQKMETEELTQEAAHHEVEHLRTLFSKKLGYDQISWLERRLIKESKYQKGMVVFFQNMHEDIDRKAIRPFDTAVTAATVEISNQDGERIKVHMLQKIRAEIPQFEQRYNALRQQLNHLDHAV